MLPTSQMSSQSSLPTPAKHDGHDVLELGPCSCVCQMQQMELVPVSHFVKICWTSTDIFGSPVLDEMLWLKGR